MISSKSREHRIRVLENLAKLAGERAEVVRGEPGDRQMKIPLIVEVTSGATTKQRARRSRSGTRKNQLELGKL